MEINKLKKVINSQEQEEIEECIKQMQLEMLSNNEFSMICQSNNTTEESYMGLLPKLLPENKKLFEKIKCLHMTIKNALHHIGVGIEYPSTSSARQVQSPYHNHGNNSNRIQKVFQNPQTSFQSQGVLIPKNNENVSAQYRIDPNEGRLMTSRDETRTATSNPDTVQNINMDRLRKNENEIIRIFSGNPEKIIHLHKIYNDQFCFYELIASVISIQEGTMSLQKILLLRDTSGPIIQVIHYTNDYINVPNFYVGQMLRCVGHMVGYNILHGLSIRDATPNEVTTVGHMCYIGDHAIAKALKKS